jgi:ABC-type multidrug transport system ATPase subunit
MIVIKNCSKRYDDTIVFKNINFTANKGDCIALLGANASGKTTLLKVILGVVDTDEGMVEIDNRYKIGFFLDEQLLYDEMSIENNMKVYCPLTKVERIKRKESVEHWLHYFGLAEYRKKKVKKISAGMKKRLALAVANLNDPDILLLDEPLDGLDKDYKAKFLNMVQNKQRQGALIIIATHNVELLTTTVNRWIILENGELFERDSLPGNYSIYMQVQSTGEKGESK